MGISASDIAGCQTAIEQFLPDTGTILRTGNSYPVRIIPDSSREIILPGVGSWIRVRRREMNFGFGGDILAGDRVTTQTGQVYGVTEVETQSMTYDLEVRALGVIFLASAVASTSRGGAWTSLTSPATDVVDIASIIVRSLTSMLLTPITSQFMLDTFGTEADQIAYCLADPPLGPDPFPVQPNDKLTILGVNHVVHTVQPEPGWVVLYLQIPETA